MRNLMYLLFLGALVSGCQAAVDNSANEAFEKNSKVVMDYLASWQAENVDYAALFNENAWMRPTGVGSQDSMGFEDMKANDQRNFAVLDFKMMSDVSLLPGVNTETKKVDGSVRYYGLMNVTLSATDSTEAVSTDVKIYQSFDFDKNGKIAYVQTYGDWGGLWEYFEDALEGEEEGEMETEDMEEESSEE
jgi:hypothetical protein